MSGSQLKRPLRLDEYQQDILDYKIKINISWNK